VTPRVVAPGVTAPRCRVPQGACDTHMHVFGGPAFAHGPSPYPLPEASPEVHASVCATLGMQRAVLVQPAPYGRDPACLLDALQRGAGRLRGVMIADETVTDATLEAWHGAGVRALRFVEMRAPGGAGRYPGAIGVEALQALAPRLRELGWQAHLWASTAQCAELLPRLVPIGVPLVLDHTAMAGSTEDPAFAAVLRYVRAGDAWVKVTLSRLPQTAGADALRSLQDALVAANPNRVLWGSDWPFVRMNPAPDAGAMLDMFLSWLGDDGLAHHILVRNPSELFGFDQ